MTPRTVLLICIATVLAAIAGCGRLLFLGGGL
jgi:predicted small lipoprotein YifL